MSMTMFVSIAAGGAAGAIGRYLVMSQVAHWVGDKFPYSTLAVNVLGSLILGVLIELFALSWSASQETRALLTVGVLGAFTTFSTFSMDTVLLIERGQTTAAALYIVASVVLSVGALFAGLSIVRAFAA